jgi:hypothetical protein
MDIEVTYENGRYYADRNCPICGDKITHSTNGNQKHAKYYLIRNIKTAIKKDIKCHKCTVISQTGNGNPFAGKKHSETTLSKISKSRQGKGVGSNNAMNNPENRKKVSIGLKKSWLDENSDGRRKKLSGYMLDKHKLGKLKYSPTSKTQNEILSLLKKDYNNIKLNFNIEGKLFDFVSETITPNVLNESLMIDIYVDKNHKCWIIDFGELIESKNTFLFDLNELLDLQNLPENSLEDHRIEFELRVVETNDDICKYDSKTNNGPIEAVDIASGKVPHFGDWRTALKIDRNESYE